MTNPAKKSTKAPALAKMSDLDIVHAKVIQLEGFVEFLLWEIKGDRGETLRKKFYGN